MNRYTVAANELGRLNLQTQELAKAIQGVARNIRTAAASCNPTPIPPLFAEVERAAEQGRRNHPTAPDAAQTAGNRRAKTRNDFSSILKGRVRTQKGMAPLRGHSIPIQKTRLLP